MLLQFSYALRDLSRSYKKLLSIIVTLFISLFILSLIINLETGLKKELKNNAKVLLGGDFEVDTRSKKIDPNFLDALKKQSTVSSTIEFSTMLTGSLTDDTNAFFIRLKAVDSNYPLYGNVISNPDNAMQRLQNEENAIIVNRKIFETLNLKINDTVYVKQAPFKVVGFVETVPDLGRALLFGDFAIVSNNAFQKLNITSIGSFVNYEYKIKTNNNDALKFAKTELSKFPTYKIRMPENAANNLRRLISNFSEFLSLVSISAMLIAGIGISNTLISFINQKNTSIAIMKSVGFRSNQIKQIFYIEILLLLFLITSLAYLLALAVIPQANHFIGNLGLSLESEFSFTNYLLILCTGLLVVIIFCIPTISSIEQIKATSLFRNVFQLTKFQFGFKNIALITIFLISLLSLFLIRSDKLYYTTTYFIFFFIFCGVFYLLSKTIIFILKRVKTPHSLPLRFAIKNIIQDRSIFPITVLSLGIGATLLLTLTLVGTNFKRELEKSIPEIAPDFFYVSIQKDVKDNFISYLDSKDPKIQYETVPIAPASISQINGIDPLTYIKSSNDSFWVLERDRRISWSNTPPPDNPITEGKWFDLESNDLQISLDAKVARNFGVKLNDQLTLKIYGKEVAGTVTSLRKVDYRDLSINFAMIINPKFANQLPHEYIATAKFSDQKYIDEVELVKKFPNISIITVSKYLGKITELINKIFVAVVIISSVVVIVGLMVIASAVIVQARLGIYQNLIFKILGLRSGKLIQANLIEFVFTYCSIFLIAGLFGIFTSEFVIQTIFRLGWSFELIPVLNVLLIIGFLTLLLIFINTYRFLRPSVYPLVRNE
jgi:putative ABC transport system permease protein